MKVLHIQIPKQMEVDKNTMRVKASISIRIMIEEATMQLVKIIINGRIHNRINLIEM